MALIKCPDCEKEVSSSAPSCPSCGAPISTDKESKGSGVKHLVTTQGTSKSLKLQGAIAILLMIIGASMIYVQVQSDVTPSPTGPILFAVGFVWYIINRVRKWWHHS